MSLKKADKILIVMLMILSAVLLIPLFRNAPQSELAKVYVKDQEVLSIDLSQDALYSVEGTNGEVKIEVSDHQIRVTQENSPHHLCSKQGFVSDPNTPIVCLPNETVVRIEGGTGQDTMIQ